MNSGNSPRGNVTKLKEWSERLDQMIAGSPSPDDIDRFVQDLMLDCKAFIEHEERVAVPPFTFRVCNDDEYRELLRLWAARQNAYGTTGITIGQGNNRIVGINVGKLLPLLQGVNPRRNFICNLTLPITEELVHLIDPTLAEGQVNVIVNDLVERFLGIEIPLEIKEEFARIVGESETAPPD
jgi:hypothetical protein